MDAVRAFAQVLRIQHAFELLVPLMLTAYLFPRQAIVIDQEQFDFIVVGGGSAGAVVASRLSECYSRVLLVDAGGDPPQQSLTPGLLEYLQHSRYDWNYTTENDNYSFQCHRSKTANLTSGRMLGGGSSINLMFYVRGCPGDFIPWAAAAKDSTWNWNGVLPYFIKSEKLKDKEIINSPLGIFHGTNGFLGVTRQTNFMGDKFLESFRELGNDIILDINSYYHLGYNYPMFTISDGIRQSTAYTLLTEKRIKKNLQVLKHTLVKKIIFDAKNNAVGIRAITNDNKEITLRATKEIIVSAGALNTPTLLMRSGIGPRNHLQTLNIPVMSDLPVGKNLQDHAAFVIPIKLDKSNEPLSVPNLTQFPYDTITGYVALNKSNTCPDYQTFSFVVPNDSTAILKMCVFDFGLFYEICQRIYNAGLGTRTFYTMLILLHPKSRGRVFLRSTDPKDRPLIYGGYLSDEQDLETVVDSAVNFVKILKTSYFESVLADMVDLELYGCSALKYWSRDWWKCYLKCLMTSLYHYSGTCSLGSVVDSHLRVFGVNRLRVVDASIMPELVSGNINAATIMIGEKAADFIKQDHHCNLDPLYDFFPYWPK